MADDRFAAKEAAHESGEILHLRSGDPAEAERILHPRNPAAEAEHEATAGEALHGVGVAGGDHRVTRVVVGDAGGDGDFLTHRADRTALHRRLLLVVALGDEGVSQTEVLGLAYLVDQRSRRFGRTGEGVEAEFGMGDVGAGQHGRNVVGGPARFRIRSRHGAVGRKGRARHRGR